MDDIVPYTPFKKSLLVFIEANSYLGLFSKMSQIFPSTDGVILKCGLLRPQTSRPTGQGSGGGGTSSFPARHLNFCKLLLDRRFPTWPWTD